MLCYFLLPSGFGCYFPYLPAPNRKYQESGDKDVTVIEIRMLQCSDRDKDVTVIEIRMLQSGELTLPNEQQIHI